MKIGVYGGTFNPPHLGHAAAARAVFDLLKLDLLLLVPDGQPPHKDLPAGSPTAEQRLEMTRLAGEQLGPGNKRDDRTYRDTDCVYHCDRSGSALSVKGDFFYVQTKEHGSD